MRTTLNLDDDILYLAKQVAARDHISLGQAISRLVRHGAGMQTAGVLTPGSGTQALRGRFALLARRDEVITPMHIRELMDSEGI